MRANLPPLNALRAFEAVARCGSLNAAAAELGVVRGAVRQQLAVIEAHFGRPLFTRAGRRLQLSEDARAYFAEVTEAFARLRRASDAFARLSGTLRFGVPAAFAMWWLMPRLSRLEAAMGAQPFTIVPLPAVRPLDRLDDIDAVIMGAEFRPTAGISAVPFLADEFGPVLAPSLAPVLATQTAGSPGETPDISLLAPLTAISAGTAPTLWADWFSEAGHTPVSFARTTHLEDLVLALTASRAGNGVTIAPKASIEDDLASGRLVAPFGFHLRAAGYHVCYRADDPAERSIRRFVEWLVSEAE
jgi:LysR family glycine cleavage system transcriptional activator